MNQNNLIFAYTYNNDDGSKILNDILVDDNGKAFVWYHFNGSEETTENSLLDKLLPNPIVYREMLSNETRPSIKSYNDGFLIILRCMNYNPESDPEDMVALHIWIKGNTVITVRKEKVFATDDIINNIKGGHSIKGSGEMLIQLLNNINSRIGFITAEIEDQVDELEEIVIEGRIGDIRTELSRIRRKIISIRRYIVPQKEVLSRLAMENSIFIDEREKWSARDESEKLIRIIEDMDMVRERGSLIHEEINNKISENMNKTMYSFSIVATIFLPLGFITGLLGINVGGMPGVNSPIAFFIVCFICFILFIFEFLFFRRNRLL